LRLRDFLLLAVMFAPLSFADEWRYTGVERIVAVSDIHGAYAPFERTLLQAGIVNASLVWAAGAAHLVINGDLLDGGPDSRSVMDLVMRLEGEAVQAGGRVHVLLGDHEVMNLVGDLRYVSTEEYAAFTNDEPPEERERWFQRYKAQQLAVGEETALRVQFDVRYPPGFFGHRAAFGSDGTYGSWLLEKPLIVIINDTVFVHGGLSPRVAEMGLDGINGINGTMKSELVEYVRALNVLVEAGPLDPGESFNDHGIFGLDSPILYRGNVSCPSLIEVDRLDEALDNVDAKRVVIGHTPTIRHKVLTRFGGRLIEIDTGMLHATYQGKGHALKIEDDTPLVVAERGPGPFRPTEYVRRVEVGEKSMRVDTVERLLGNGDITVGKVLPGGLARVTVSGPEGTVDAIFRPKSRARQYVPELAAYRLDSYLKLDMVPVTVARKLDGKAGTLRLAASMLEAETPEYRPGSIAGCPLQDQRNAMRIFDVLTDNADHGESFGVNYVHQAQFRKVPLAIGSAWQVKLAGLDESKIDELLEDVLDLRRRRALRQRRDELLTFARENPARVKHPR